MTTTFRTDSRAAVLAVLNTRKAASPTLLRMTYRARPGSFPQTPCAYVGASSERITYTYQTRTRTMTGFEVVVVDTLTDASETEDRMDVLVDLLVDDFGAAYASVSGGGGLLQLTSVTDTEIALEGPNGAAIYRAAVFGFGDPVNPTFIMEGRP